MRSLAKLTKSERRVEGLKADMTQHHIRLWGSDAPETAQDFDSPAEQAASSHAIDRQVAIPARGTDRYGRTVAEVVPGC